jgi:two-component system sensor histidine kinase KdpD
VNIGSDIVQDRYYARLSVEDFGIGIAEDDQERVFEPFVRSERTYDIPGTGIGLALVKTIVAQHDGTITLKSAPNQGTTVIIRLPAMEIAHLTPF